MLGDEGDECFEHLDLGELPPLRTEGELGEDLPERRQAPAVELDAGERVSERRSERHVRQVPLELGAARTPDAHVRELELQLVEQSRLAEPGFSLDLDQRDVAGEARAGRRA